MVICWKIWYIGNMKMLIQHNNEITEVQKFTNKIKKIYLGKRELSPLEFKYIQDTQFWNLVENSDLLKNIENELNKNGSIY